VRLNTLFVGSVRRLAITMNAAIALVWRAAPARAAAVTGLQLASAALLGAQVLLGREAATAMLTPQAGGSVRAAIAPLTALAAISAISGLAAPALALQNRLLGELAQRAAYDRILEVTTTVELRQFDDPDFADQLQRVQANAVPRPLLVTGALMQLVGAAAAAGVLTITLFALHPWLPLVLLAVGAPLLLVSRRSGAAEFAFAVGQSPSARLRDHLRAVMTGHDEAREVRAYDLSHSLRHRYARVCDRYLGDLRQLVNRRHRQAALAGVFTAAATILTLLFLVRELANGSLTLADAGAAVLAVKLLSTRLELAFTAAGTLYESALFLEDLNRFTALAPSRPGPSSAPPAFQVLRIRDVGFRYPNSAQPSLTGVNLTIRRGEVIGLIGENGSGKSTLAMLLAGLLTPTEGQITWDGVDLATHDPAAVRRHVTVLFAEPTRYALPAADNIAPGVSDTSTPQARVAVSRSARAAGADAFVRRLPQGYDTLLSGEYAGGTNLSKGQWQRIALARAFHRDASLVVLDEPATGLDPRAEHELFETVRTLAGEHTVIMISHRLSNVRGADRIVVLSDGRVAEEGDHDTLVSAGGRYADLFSLQANGYTPTL
jgi:ATP-binding cassette subfamily B protein